MRIEIPSCDPAAVHRLERELGVGGVVAQVLVRRGLDDPEAARAFLAAEERHPWRALGDAEGAVALILEHVRSASRITVHGDYDVDGVCSTAVLVRGLRRLGAEVDWLIPSREDDGYGLSATAVERIATRGTRLLMTVDCAITAVDEVAAARAAGLDVVVTDHHRPRADGRLPEAPIVHPAFGGYPCADLCATAVAAKLVEGLLEQAGEDPAGADDDLDLVALATVADVVPLLGENRRLVREGIRAMAATAKPGLRALMRVARLDPGALDAHGLAFRLAPRINAAGRLARADAGLELILTEDERRAHEIAEELDRRNVERRHVEERILFEAEGQVARAGERPAYVLAGQDWHPGVIGIVAARIAERHHRPAVLIALTGETGVGSARSIPGFDLLAGLNACAEHLDRHGGHRAAAGLELHAGALDSFRVAFEAHAESVLEPDDLVPRERIDAVVGGDALGLELTEELERLAPFGAANPSPALLVPGAIFRDPRGMGEDRHCRFAVESGGVRCRAVAFGTGPTRLPVDEPHDASFRLERNVWNGAEEPRLVLRHALPCAPAPIALATAGGDWLTTALGELAVTLDEQPHPPPGERTVRDHRGRSILATLTALVASGEPVLAVCAEAEVRRRQLAGRIGGFLLCDWGALERDPQLAAAHRHVAAIDPPLCAAHEWLLHGGSERDFAYLAWGEPELRFAEQIHERDYGLRATLIALYRDLRAAGGAAGSGELEAVLRGSGRTAAQAGRALRVLVELGFVSLDPDLPAVSAPSEERAALERSPAYRAYQRRYEDGRRYRSGVTRRAA